MGRIEDYQSAHSTRILYGPLKDAVESMIRDVLAPVTAHAGFFVYLEADLWSVRFLGVNGGQADSAAAERLDQLLEPIKKHYQRSGDENPQRRLFKLALDLQKRSGLTLKQMQGAAVHWLIMRRLALGNTSRTGDDAQKIHFWSVPGEARPLLRFQNAIDWAATYGGDLERMRAEREDVASCSQINRTVLKVPGSAAYRNLVTGENLDIILAEHIISLDEESLSRSADATQPFEQSLNFFLMPIRGLGQWRAAIDWIGRQAGKRDEASVNNNLDLNIGRQASELSQSALEELLTLSLINIFAHTARKALAPFTFRLEHQKRKLSDAFAMLWWSREIRLYKHGFCIERLTRQASSTDADRESVEGMLVADASDVPPAASEVEWNEVSQTFYPTLYPGFFSYNGKTHPELTIIRLKIDPVIARVTDDAEERARLKYDAPFDEVWYYCHLFDADEEEIRRFADQLGECLEQIVIEQNLRRIAHEKAQYAVYEDIGHVLGTSLSIAGLNDSRKTLRTDLCGLVEQRPKLRKVSNSLTLLTILEGSVGLLRLIGILHRHDFSKLEEWFDDASIAAWESKEKRVEEKVFQLYHDAVVHLARSIGSAFGRPWLEVTVGEQTTRYNEECHFDLNNLNFLPLSRARRGEAIYALLPALVEPLINALKFMDDVNEHLPLAEPIKLLIEDNRRKPMTGTPCIHVEVRNLCPAALFPNPQDLKRDPSGVKTTRRFLALTEMATLKRTQHRDEHRVLSILLHPKKLYDKIPPPAAKETDRRSTSLRETKTS
jgi:hypothetical protein